MLQLARSLALVAPVGPLQAALDLYTGAFQQALTGAVLERLGLVPMETERDLALVAALEAALARKTVPIDRFFFDWRGGRRRGPSPADQAYAGEDFAALGAMLADYQAAPGALDHAYWSDAGPCSMHIEEVEAIWSAIDQRDDWAPFEAKIAAVRRMGEAMRPRGGAA